MSRRAELQFPDFDLEENAKPAVWSSQTELRRDIELVRDLAILRGLPSSTCRSLATALVCTWSMLRPIEAHFARVDKELAEANKMILRINWYSKRALRLADRQTWRPSEFNTVLAEISRNLDLLIEHEGSPLNLWMVGVNWIPVLNAAGIPVGTDKLSVPEYEECHYDPSKQPILETQLEMLKAISTATELKKSSRLRRPRKEAGLEFLCHVFDNYERCTGLRAHRKSDRLKDLIQDLSAYLGKPDIATETALDHWITRKRNGDTLLPMIQ